MISIARWPTLVQPFDIWQWQYYWMMLVWILEINVKSVSKSIGRSVLFTKHFSNRARVGVLAPRKAMTWTLVYTTQHLTLVKEVWYELVRKINSSFETVYAWGPKEEHRKKKILFFWYWVLSMMTNLHGWRWKGSTAMSWWRSFSFCYYWPVLFHWWWRESCWYWWFGGWTFS